MEPQRDASGHKQLGIHAPFSIRVFHPVALLEKGIHVLELTSWRI